MLNYKNEPYYTEQELAAFEEIAGVKLFTLTACRICNIPCVHSYYGGELNGSHVFDYMRNNGISEDRIYSGSESEKGIICRECGNKLYKEKEAKRMPKLARRILREIKPVFVCPICDRYHPRCFKTRAGLEAHIMTHTLEKIEYELQYWNNKHVMETED